MKRLFLTCLVVAAGLTMTSCDFLSEWLESLLEEGLEDTEYVDKWANLVNETVQDWSVSGNSLTYGSHTYTIVKDIDPETEEFKTATASVTFTNIPSGLNEFTTVYENLLGKTVAGAAAMIPMAMEIYARNASTGRACLEVLCNSSSTVDEIVRELKQKIVPSEYSPEDDQYIQRFLPAALLKGAAPTNAYKPSSPYTVEMTMSPNGVQNAELTGGVVTYIYILTSGGWDTYQRGVDIFLPYNKDHYKVFNCPSCYTQCKHIQGTWAGLK